VPRGGDGSMLVPHVHHAYPPPHFHGRVCEGSFMETKPQEAG
jgi:hypothetical protein